MTFPFKNINDLSTKLKAAEAEISKLQDDCDDDSDECQQTAALVNCNQCEQTLPSVQSEVDRLKRMVADLTYENNRYHLALSNCHCSTLDDSISNVPAESRCIDSSLHTFVQELAKLRLGHDVKHRFSFGNLS